MKLKSSNSNPYKFFGVLLIIVLVLFSLKIVDKKKSSKDVSTPIFEQKTTLNLLQITLKEKHYNKLKKKRDKAIAVGILETSDNDYVPVIISFNGKEYKAEIRLKGDWTDHLVGDKWSFRVKLKGDKTILGMRKFSIHHPKTRGFINEWLYHKAIKKEGIIGLRYDFLEGALHIKKENSLGYVTKEVGIYAIEETFDKRTIENNGRKESVILKFSEDYWWAEIKKSIKVGAPSGIYWRNFVSSTDFPITLFSESKSLQDSVLHKYFKLSKNLLSKVKASKISISDAFDIKKLALQNAILNLFDAYHGNYIINVRFYYNPITSKLEPIAFDGNSGGKLKKYISFIFVKENKDSIYQKELIFALEKISSNEYLNNLINENKNEFRALEKILKSEFYAKQISIENLRYNQNILKEEQFRLQKKYSIKGFGESIASNNYETISLSNIFLPKIIKWRRVNSFMKEASFTRNNEMVFKISKNKPHEPSYILIDNIDVNRGREYQISFIVKKGEFGNHVGLRMQGKYPNRVDAVFDLKQGLVKGVKNTNEFKNEKASIESLGDGWYRCSLSGIVNVDKIKIIFGATNNKKNILSWESPTPKTYDIFVISNSLTFEEIVH